MIPSDAQSHRPATADSGQKNPLRMDMETAAGNLDASEDARLGSAVCRQQYDLFWLLCERSSQVPRGAIAT
jgi:hypothetical protein